MFWLEGSWMVRQLWLNLTLLCVSLSVLSSLFRLARCSSRATTAHNHRKQWNMRPESWNALREKVKIMTIATLKKLSTFWSEPAFKYSRWSACSLAFFSRSLALRSRSFSLPLMALRSCSIWSSSSRYLFKKTKKSLQQVSTRRS